MKHYLLPCLFLLSFVAHAAPKSDEYYMGLALQNAQHNLKVPFAAVIVNNSSGQVMCQGLNSVDARHNPTLHGEIDAINNCSKKYPKMDWKNSTLYTTAEPCPMCQTAIIWANIPRVVYGTSIAFMDEHKWDSITLRADQMIKYADFYHGTITGGVLHEKTDPLFATPFWLKQ